MMKDKQVHTLDALFREELGNARVQPSDQLWENIRTELDAKERAGVAGIAQYTIPWKVWLAAASVGILLAIGLTLVLNRPQVARQEFADTTLEEVVPATETPFDQQFTPAPPVVVPPTSNPALAENPGTPAGIIPPVPSLDRPSREKEMPHKTLPVPVVHQSMPLAVLSLDQKHPGRLHAAQIPVRTGHDLDRPYAFFSPDELDLELPDFVAIEEQNKTEPSKWAVGGVFSPDFSLSGAQESIVNLGSDRAGAFGFAQSSQVFSNGSSRAFSSGVSLAYEVNQRIELQGGVTFSQRSSTPGSGGYIQIQDNSTVATGSTVYADYASSFTNTYLEVPMTMQYSLRPEKKLDVFLTSGVSTQLFIQNESAVASSDERISGFNSVDAAPLSPYQWNVLVGAGAEYAFNDHFSMNVEPLMRKSMTPRGKSYPGNPNLSVSLRTGLNYHF